MSFIAVSFLCALQAGTAPPTGTPPPKADPTYLIRVKGAPGDTYTYASHLFMSDESAQHTIEVEAKIEDKFVRQYEEQIDWSQILTLKKISAKGQLRPMISAFEAISGVPVMRVTNDRGRLLKVIVGEIVKDSRGGPDVVFPKSAVKIGDYWDAPVETGGQVFDIRYQLMSVSDVAGRQTAYIEGTYHPDQDIVNVEKHQFYVDLLYGKVISSKIYAVLTTQGIQISVWASTTLEGSKSGDDGKQLTSAGQGRLGHLVSRHHSR